MPDPKKKKYGMSATTKKLKPKKKTQTQVKGKLKRTVTTLPKSIGINNKY